MAGHQGDVGGAYLETQRAMCRIRGKNRPSVVVDIPFFCFRQLPPSSARPRFGSLLVRVSDGIMSGDHDDFGWEYLEAQQAPGGICGKNRPILVMIIPLSCFRLLPSASVSFRFGSFLVRVSDGNMSGGQDDFGREYLETQHALCHICGENRPILAMRIPFSVSFGFRLLPSASAISRQPPLRVASGPCG